MLIIWKCVIKLHIHVKNKGQINTFTHFNHVMMSLCYGLPYNPRQAVLHYYINE